MRHTAGPAGALVDVELDPFMSSLDISPDTEVEVTGFDEDARAEL